MKREPLTSTVVPGATLRRRRAARSSSAVAKCAAPAPNAAAASAASSPAREQRVDAGRARLAAGLAVERRTLRADLAHVAQHQPAAAPARAASTAIAARTESGLAL